MDKRIYLDNAATTPLEKSVLDDMIPYLTENYGNASSLHFYGRKALSAVDLARDGIASILQVKGEEIYFTSGGTESDNWALLGVMRPLMKEGKNHLIVSSIEHSAVLETARALEREGAEVSYVNPNADGVVEPSVIEKEIRDNTALVSVMYVNNETGVVQKVKEIAKICHERGCLFFSDAVQGASYLLLSPKTDGIDLMSLSAHKFHGPKGVGVLYVRSGVKMDNALFGGLQERGKRGGTVNVAGIVGFASAYALCVKERAENNEKITLARRAFENELLNGVEGITINGAGEKIPSICNFTIRGVSNDTFMRRMDLEGIALSTGAACMSGVSLPSATLLAMGRSVEESRSAVRVSFGKQNTEQEGKTAGEIAVKIIKELRGE